MSFAKPLSWNLFGTSFDGKDVSVHEAFEEAGLNFSVDKDPLVRMPQTILDAYLSGRTPIWRPTSGNVITTHKATYREDTNTTLGVVGEGYGVVQNEKAFDFLNFIEEAAGEKLQIATAGALGDGQRVFITAKLGADCYLNPQDAINNYVVFSTTHDGSGAVSCFFTPIRIICQNTLNMAIRECPNKVVFKHSKYVGDRINFDDESNRKKAFEVFAKSVNFSKQFSENMLMLKSQNVTEAETQDFAAKIAFTPAQFKLWKLNGRNAERVDEISTRAENIYNSLRTAIDSGIGQNYNRGTKVWLLNGLTTYLHNEKKWKSPQDEFKSLMDGDGARKVQFGYDLLMAA